MHSFFDVVQRAICTIVPTKSIPDTDTLHEPRGGIGYHSMCAASSILIPSHPTPPCTHGRAREGGSTSSCKGCVLQRQLTDVAHRAADHTSHALDHIHPPPLVSNVCNMQVSEREQWHARGVGGEGEGRGDSWGTCKSEAPPCCNFANRLLTLAPRRQLYLSPSRSGLVECGALP